MPVSNQTYNNIIKEYDDRRRSRELLIEERRTELYSTIPGFREADLSASENASLYLDKFLSSKHNDKVRESYHALIEDAKAKKVQLLAKAGYPADYLDPPYVCPDCRDTGYIGTDKCHCLKQKLIDAAYLQQPQMRQLLDCNISDFITDYYPQYIHDKTTGINAYDSACKALTDANVFINEYDIRHGNLILYGDTGAGKTFLSCCIGNAIQAKGYTVVYQSAGRFFDILSDHTFRRSRADSSDYDNIFDCDLLILDDLGTEMTNTFTNTSVFDCINDRILTGKSTIISTNLTMQEIFDTYTGRVFSRLSKYYTWLHLFGADLRIRLSSESRIRG